MEGEIREKTLPSFFKIMFPIPRISKKLKIPPEFVERIDKRAFKKATLRDYSGRSWPVKLYEKKKGIFVKDGWDQFFEANSLGHFEFVTFTYDGERCFNVKIFRKDGTEKLEDDNASSGLISFYSEDENKSEEDNVYDAPTRAKVVSNNGRRKRGRPRKNTLPNPLTPLSPHGKGQYVPHRLSNELKQLGVSKSSKKSMKEVEIIGPFDRFYDSANERVYQDKQVVSYRGMRELKQPGVTKSSKKQKEIQTIESPEEEIAFGLKNIENEKVYQSNEHMNAVEKVYSTKADVQKRKRGRPVGSKNKNKGHGLMCNVSEYSKKPDEDNGLRDEIKREIINLCDDELDFGYEKLNNCNGIYTNNESFISKFPFFEISIDLENDNKKYMTSLPNAFVKRYFPNEKTRMTLINEKGKYWEVKFNPAQNRFIRGWIQFVRDNKLMHGDRCIFELVREKEIKFHISSFGERLRARHNSVVLK